MSVCDFGYLVLVPLWPLARRSRPAPFASFLFFQAVEGGYIFCSVVCLIFMLEDILYIMTAVSLVLDTFIGF